MSLPEAGQSAGAQGVQWRLISEECVGCGICADVCGYQAIVMSRDMPYPEAVLGACTACNACVIECPFQAIEVRAV